MKKTPFWTKRRFFHFLNVMRDIHIDAYTIVIKIHDLTFEGMGGHDKKEKTEV